jgi:hypothetical protein
MNNVQNCDSYINIPSSQTYTSRSYSTECTALAKVVKQRDSFYRRGTDARLKFMDHFYLEERQQVQRVPRDKRANGMLSPRATPRFMFLDMQSAMQDVSVAFQCNIYFFICFYTFKDGSYAYDLSLSLHNFRSL